MQTSEKRIAIGPPSRSGPAPSVKNDAIRLTSISTTTPMMAATMKRVNFGVTRMAPVL